MKLLNIIILVCLFICFISCDKQPPSYINDEPINEEIEELSKEFKKEHKKIGKLPKIVRPSMSNVIKMLYEMEFGSIAFNSPTNINLYDSAQIQLILSLAETVEELKQSITEEGVKIGANIKVSSRMEALLSGEMFHITEITPKIQAVSKSQQTEWNWEIHPKKIGNHKLHLALIAHLEVDGHSTPRSIRTFDKIIEVNVSSKQKISLFFKNNWKWLWAAILVPVAGWLWKRKQKKGGKLNES